jgi:SAM-dependent methyltransferase
MTEPDASNRAQADYWESRTSSWIAGESYISLVGSPFGRFAIDALAPAPGDTVLDVGCGTGPTTVELARRVAPGGRVVGMDIAPSMLEAARARATDAGVDNASFVAGDAQTADLGESLHHGVFSQFGIMFFADPLAAFANLRRSLREGGCLAFACWQDLFSNEWMFVPGAAAMGVTGEVPPMPAPGEPGPFSLSDPEVITALLTGAGFSDVTVTPRNTQVVVPAADVDTVVDAASQVGAVREALEGIDDPAVRERIRVAVRDALVERVEADELRLSSAAFVVTARR